MPWGGNSGPLTCLQEDERNASDAPGAEGIPADVSLGRRFRAPEAHPGHSGGTTCPTSRGAGGGGWEEDEENFPPEGTGKSEQNRTKIRFD